jgi:predicted transcriptional regulator
LKGKRTLYEIYWEILTHCRNPKTFTNIVQRCSLNSKIAQEHIDFLLNKGYLYRFEEEGQSYLKTTEEAKSFLSFFRGMYVELFNKSPQFKLGKRREINLMEKKADE